MTIIIPTTDNVARPRAHGYDGSIDTTLFRLGVTPETPIEDLTAEASPQKIDTSESAEDIRDEVGQRYSRSNLSGGAGLDFMHSPMRSQDASIRIWDSKGVDLFNTDRGDIYSVPLMHAMTDEATSTGIVSVCSVDDTVYYASNAGIYEYVPSGSDVQKVSLSATKMVAMGNSLYVNNLTGGVDRYPVATFTPVSVTATTMDDIWAVKSRIVGAVNNILYDEDGTTAILTLATDETINDVVDVGPAVLVFASSGFIHALTLDESLALVSAGQSKFIDEIPLMAAVSSDTIGIITGESTQAGGNVSRFYTASLGLSGSYELEDLQLIYQIGDRDTTADLRPGAMLATRDSIYAAIQEEGESEVTLWRYYLPTGGYARAHTVNVQGTSGYPVVDLCQVDDRMYAAASLDGLHVEDDTYVSTGYIIGPLADFYTADDKQWVSGELTGVEMPAGTVMKLWESNDSAAINDPDSDSWSHTVSLGVGDTERFSTPYTGVNARYHTAKVTLGSDSTRVFSPRFRSYSFRALPNPDRDILVRIPINVSDQVDSPWKRAINVPGRGEAIEAVLRSFEGKQASIELFRPALQVRGIVEKFESTIESITTFGAVRRIMYALIRGTRLSEIETSYGVATTGDNLGVATLGTITIGTRGTP